MCLLPLCRKLIILLIFSLSFSCSSDKHAESKQAQTETDKLFTVGDLAPNFSLPLVTGEKASLADFRGKRVLINFWATWCIPCMKELPDLVKLDSATSNDTLMIVSVNLDPTSKLESVQSVIEEKRIEFPVFLDPELTILESYGISGFPETFLLDENGRFLEIYDAKYDRNSLRVLSDRPWGSKEYIASVVGTGNNK